MRWLHFPSVLAAMDETTPEGPSGIYYVVAAAILVADADTASKPSARARSWPLRPVGWWTAMCATAPTSDMPSIMRRRHEPRAAGRDGSFASFVSTIAPHLG